MTPGEAFLASVPLKTVFYDRYEERAYRRAIQIAKRIVDDPSTIQNAVSYIERHVRSDPRQAATYEMWKRLLQASGIEIAVALLEDSERGTELRNTAPVFVVLGGETALESLR